MKFFPIAAAGLMMNAASFANVGRQEAAQPVQEKLNIAYAEGAGSAHTLDLYLPGGAVKAPLILYIHGGAWVSGDKSQSEKVARAFARRGIAVASMNYRLSDGRTNRHPAHVEDVATAFRWLRANGPGLGIDPGRVFLAGHSAGAHLASLLTLDPRYLAAVGDSRDAVSGVIGIAGIYDIPAIVRTFPEYREQFVTAAFGGSEKGWADASPTLLARKTRAAWLLIHSSADELVDTAQARSFGDRLRAAGAAVEVMEVERLSHFGLVSALGDAADETAARIAAFISGPSRP